jgi:hypothetical protein
LLESLYQISIFQVKLFSIFQFIDNKPADIFFYDLVLLEKLRSDKEIPANTMDAVLVDWLEKVNIEFDKSGTITQMKADVKNLKKKLQVPAIEMKKFESLVNSAYITNKRYFQSNNPDYYEILEIKFLQDLYTILMAYFEFRNIPWRGEKQVLKYLKDNDTKFYDLYMSCFRASSIKEKFEIYSRLVKAVFYGDYGLWGDSVINPYTKSILDNNERERLIDYWRSLTK